MGYGSEKSRERKFATEPPKLSLKNDHGQPEYQDFQLMGVCGTDRYFQGLRSGGDGVKMAFEIPTLG